jgi:uncharacterized protein
MAYHIRREDREIKDRSTMDEIIRAGKYAVCALCSDNEPYIVTLSYGYDKEAGTLSFHCADEGVKLDFIRKNPRACITIIDDCGYMENICSHAYRTVIIRGSFELIADQVRRKKAIKLLIDHLETNPDKMMEKVDSNSAAWQRTQMLGFSIEEISGKERKRK